RLRLLHYQSETLRYRREISCLEGDRIRADRRGRAAENAGRRIKGDTRWQRARLAQGDWRGTGRHHSERTKCARRECKRVIAGDGWGQRNLIDIRQEAPSDIVIVVAVQEVLQDVRSHRL